jgi:hypothetical protein
MPPTYRRSYGSRSDQTALSISSHLLTVRVTRNVNLVVSKKTFDVFVTFTCFENTLEKIFLEDSPG